MKVVRTSNFDDEMYTEAVVAEGLTESEARDKAAQLNSTGGLMSPDYYVVKPDDYKPHEFEP